MALRIRVEPELVDGDVAEGYGALADAFRANFAERGEIGAACVVYRDGQRVVQLWGGFRDGHRRLPWQRDTIVPVFSTSKGMSALTVALAQSRGLLDYDRPVASYWPEFGARGKDAITVRELLTHRAGVPVLDRDLTVAQLADLDGLAGVLADQAPLWRPGTRHGYHSISLGWYCNELIRRTDPAGRSLGRYFAEELAGPLELDFHIGLPDTVDPERIALIHGFGRAGAVRGAHVLPWRFAVDMLNPRSLTARTFTAPRALASPNRFNRPEVQRLELPSSNGIGGADSIARAYSLAATRSPLLPISDAAFAELTGRADTPSGGSHDLVLRTEAAYALGFSKPLRGNWFGSPTGRAFGTPGLGGSFGFADPDTGIGFAYVMNRTGTRLHSDPREVALRDALYRIVLRTDRTDRR